MVKNVEKLFAAHVADGVVADGEEGVAAVGDLPVGRADRVPRLRQPGPGEVHAVHRRGLPIRATCQVTLEELAGDAPKQNPTSGGLVPHRVHQVVAGDSLPAHRLPASTATRPCGGRSPTSTGSTTRCGCARATGCCCRRSRSWRAPPPAGDPARRRAGRSGARCRTVRSSATPLLVKVNGTPLPDDVKPLLVNGYVDDSSNVPDLFVLRFSDEGGTVLAKAQLRDRREGRAQPAVDRSRAAAACCSTRRGHRASRWSWASGRPHGRPGARPSHRLFRGTRVEAYVNMTASDIVEKVAQRAGLDGARSSDDHHARPHQRRTASTTGTSCAGWPPSTTGCSRWSTASSSSCARTPATEAPGGSAGSRAGPARPRARGEPRAPPRHDHLRRPGPGGRGARAGTRAEEGARRHAGRRRPQSAVPDSGVTPASAGRDVRRARRTSWAWRPVATRPRSTPSPARSPTTSRAASPSWRVRRGATPRCAPARPSRLAGVGDAVRRASTC